MAQSPKTMRGVVLTGHGGFDRLEVRDDLRVPTPGQGEVLIGVGASAVNNTDINTRIGWYSKAVRGDTASGARAGFQQETDGDGSWSGGVLSFPRIQGADCCGRIVAVGTGVSPGRVGQRVLVRAIQSPSGSDAVLPTATLGSESDGAFAEFMVAPAVDAIVVQSRWSDVELASFPCAFSTAEGMIQRCGLGPERVVIAGASGGVGSGAIQLAKRRGAHVTAISSPSKWEELRALGADEVLDRDTELPHQEFHVVLDLVGGPHWGALVDSLRVGGRYVTAGAIAGPIVELDLRTLYLRDLSFFGCTHQPPNIFTDLVSYIEAEEIRPVVASIYPLNEMRNAQEAFLSKSHVGKIGILVGAESSGVETAGRP